MLFMLHYLLTAVDIDKIVIALLMTKYISNKSSHLFLIYKFIINEITYEPHKKPIFYFSSKTSNTHILCAPLINAPAVPVRTNVAKYPPSKRTHEIDRT